MERDETASGTAVELHEVSFIRAGHRILDDISLSVGRGEHWALIGPNGAGKSTLLNICGAVTFPSRGFARILGYRLGEVDLRALRQWIGFVNPRHPLESNLSARTVVLTGATGTIELIPRWTPAPHEVERAELLMKTMGIDGPGADGAGRDGPDQPHWHTMSQGERGRTLIARALMAEPPLLLLDEPSTGLDVAAREQMIDTITGLPDAIGGLTTIMVTHHFEELPPSTTHAALLRNGRLLAAGPVEAVLTTELITECFDHPLQVERRAGRWSVTARRG